MNSGMCLL